MEYDFNSYWGISSKVTTVLILVWTGMLITSFRYFRLWFCIHVSFGTVKANLINNHKLILIHICTSWPAVKSLWMWIALHPKTQQFVLPFHPISQSQTPTSLPPTYWLCHVIFKYTLSCYWNKSQCVQNVFFQPNSSMSNLGWVL